MMLSPSPRRLCAHARGLGLAQGLQGGGGSRVGTGQVGAGQAAQAAGDIG